MAVKDEIEALEEARLAVEQIVIPKSQPVNSCLVLLSAQNAA